MPLRIRASLPTTLLLSTLLTLGCSSEPREASGKSHTPPLVEAAEKGDLISLGQLLERNSKVDVRDACHWTPLMKAANNGHGEVATKLMDAGANLDLGDKGGYTPLMLAAANNHATLVNKLISRGANLNNRETTKGWTALIWSAKRGHTESVKQLLAAGADTQLRDLSGKNALDWATSNNHSDITALLKEG